MRRSSATAVLYATAGVFLAGPVHATARNPDPYEHFNRKNYALNGRIDRALIRPLSKLSSGLTPGPIGLAIHNVLQTLNEPIVILNDLLQIRPARAAKTAARLVVNVTAGILGTVDVAGKVGLPYHPNGFGDTLGHYGVGPGPYLYLPVLGPSDVRDLFGGGVDAVSTPVFFVRYAYKDDVLITLNVVGGLNQRAEVDTELNVLLGDAADPYATLRSTYLQARQGEIDGGATPSALPDIGSPGADVAPYSGSAAPDPAAPPATPPPSSGLGQPGLAPDQADPLHPLPDQKGGHADDQVPRPLE